MILKKISKWHACKNANIYDGLLKIVLLIVIMEHIMVTVADIIKMLRGKLQ